MKQKYIQYLKLTDDIAFKIYFSTNMQLLFSLIKSFLSISDSTADAVILNPDVLVTASGTANQQDSLDNRLHLQDSYIPPDILGGKQFVLDLRVKLSSGENVNIEMQNYSQRHFITRMLAYWIQLHHPSLVHGQEYSQFKPSHSLAFTTFNARNTSRHFNRATIKWDDPQDGQVTNHFEMVVEQLKNFNKSYRELVDMRDRWCYIIKHSAELTAEQVAYLSQDGETKMALEHLEEVSKEERERWNAISMSRREWERQLKGEELEEKGRIQGIQEGEVNKARGIALSMLQKGYEIPEISEVTSLPVAEIEKLNGKTAE